MAIEKMYTAYEYKEMTVKKELEPLAVDGYKNFGWKVENSRPATQKHVWGPFRVMLAPLALLPGTPFKKMIQNHESETERSIYLKRNKDIFSKNELNRLQIQFEKIVEEISSIEVSKTTGASIAAYMVGMIGTVFMALSVFSYLAGILQICIILAVPGFLGWILSAIVYKVVKERRIRKLIPIIQDKYDDIDQVCEKAYTLTLSGI